VSAGEHLASGHEEADAGLLTAHKDLDQAAVEVGLEGVARTTRGWRPLAGPPALWAW
jgi:hypothetical protein